MKELFGLIVFLTATLCLPAQSSQSTLEDISFYADAMVNSAKPEHRVLAGQKFYGLFKDYLSSSESWKNTFSDIPWITAVTPPDSTLKVITWQVEEAEIFHYYGFLQFPPTTDRMPVEFIDNRPLTSEYASHRQDQWYGAIYYGIQPFRTTDDTPAYLLLGFNAFTPRLNQRVADVLVIEDSMATLGLPVFIESDSTDAKSRIILEYADAASATMRFDREKEFMIYDHVIPINTPEGPTLVPDGSYHGFSLANGHWRFMDTVFDVISEEPPGGRAKETVKRDLFGREMDKKE